MQLVEMMMDKLFEISDSCQCAGDTNIKDLLFKIVKTLANKGVTHKQYVSMGVAFISNLRYCIGDSFTNEDLEKWKTVYCSVLKTILPVVIAYEITSASCDPFDGSISMSREESIGIYSSSRNSITGPVTLISPVGTRALSFDNGSHS